MSSFHLPPDGHGPLSWGEEQKTEIEVILARYPTKKAAVMPLLWMVQDTWDWISLDGVRLVAQTLELPPSHVLSVASFYTMFKKRPGGRYVLQVCHTLSCELAGSEALLGQISEKLGIGVGETTEDGMFSIERVECLAACGAGPMMQVNEDYHELVTEEKLQAILDAIRSGEPLSTPRPEAEQWTYTPVS